MAMDGHKYQESTKIFALAKMYQKGKIQVPSEVRRKLSIIDGEKILFLIKDGNIVIEKA